jgi:hypothetical protein
MLFAQPESHAEQRENFEYVTMRAGQVAQASIASSPDPSRPRAADGCGAPR